MKRSKTYNLYLKALGAAGFVERFFGKTVTSSDDVILCYHDVGERDWDFNTTKKDFELQIKALKNKFEIVNLDEILDISSNKHKPRLSITFDDGHRGILTNALPILKKHGLTATVFITGNRNLRIDDIENLLSIKEIKKLAAEGWEIGWHTMNHPDLTKLSQEEMDYEINRSKRTFEEKNNIKVKYFAYPYGIFNAQVKDIIDPSEFTHAFTVDGGSVQNSDLFSTSRNTVGQMMNTTDVENMCTELGLKITKLFTRIWKLVDKLGKKDHYDIIISTYDDINNPYYAGGGAVSIHELAKRLSKKYKIKIITSKYPDSKNKVIDGVVYEHIGVSWVGPRLGQLLFQLFLIPKLMKEDFNLWIENFTPPFSTSFLPLFTKRTVIGLVHMLSAEDMRRKYYLPFDVIQNLGLKKYKHFIVVNEMDEQKIRKINKKAKIIQIPNGIKMPNSMNKSNSKNVLFLGRIEVDQKGLDLLILAIKNIKEEKDINLFIAGTGSSDELDKLDELLSESNLNGKVKLLGRVGNKRKKELLRKSACLVIPSRYETFSMAALEGLSYGIPVVTYDIPGLRWIPEVYSYKSKKFDTNDLSKNIVEATHEKKSDLRKKRINFARSFDWDKIQIRYENYLSDFIE